MCIHKERSDIIRNILRANLFEYLNYVKLSPINVEVGSSDVGTARPNKALKTLSFQGFIFCLLRSFMRGVTQFATQICEDLYFLHSTY